MAKSYKERIPLDKRISESDRILAKYPNYVPIIVEIDNKIGEIQKNKFLVPRDVSAGHLMCSIRAQIKCRKDEALFMFQDNTLICSTTIVGQLYDSYIDKLREKSEKNSGGKAFDKFYYIFLKQESTFGGQ